MPIEAKRDLVSIDDLSTGEILELFAHADEFREDPGSRLDLCRGSIMATLFFEPSTRTRLSFESAMLRLGGRVITAAEADTTSRAKGESLADTVRVVGGSYADILVVRHPQDGAARVAARYARVPVINGGDGTHEHPTQALCDLYTLWKEKGRLRGLDVVLCGDLRYSRTIQSFTSALARFEANIITIPYPGFEMEPHVQERLKRDYGVHAVAASVGDLPGIASSDNAVAYFTASKPHQLALFTSLTPYQVRRIDAVYMTRSQSERHGGGPIEGYPRISGASMRSELLKEASVMHPLPRVDEIDYEMDDDPRSVYFRQAEFGVPIRMALMAFQLGRIELKAKPEGNRSTAPGISFDRGGPHCRNQRCVTNSEGTRYLVRDFRLREASPPVLSCAYCDREFVVTLVGNAATRLYHRYNSAEARRIKADNQIYFESEAQARAAQFRAPGEPPGEAGQAGAET